MTLDSDELPDRLYFEPREESDPRPWIAVLPRRWVYLEGWRAAHAGLALCPYDGLLEQAWRAGFTDAGGQTLLLPRREASATGEVLLELREVFAYTAAPLPTRSIVRSAFHVGIDRAARYAAHAADSDQLPASSITSGSTSPTPASGRRGRSWARPTARQMHELLEAAEHLCAAGWTVRPPHGAIGPAARSSTRLRPSARPRRSPTRTPAGTLVLSLYPGRAAVAPPDRLAHRKLRPSPGCVPVLVHSAERQAVAADLPR